MHAVLNQQKLYGLLGTVDKSDLGCVVSLGHADNLEGGVLGRHILFDN